MTASSRYFPVLLVLFLGSGCSALIYEIVWYHMLQLNIGSTAISLGVLLATYMGGLCIGSAGLGARAARAAGIRCGSTRCSSSALPHRRSWCWGSCRSSGALMPRARNTACPSMLLRAVLAAICLLPPTILMGASLPAVARWIPATPEGRSRVGLLYGANTIGAVLGCLTAGFYLLRMYNVQVATFAAAALNVAVAIGGFVAARTALPRRADEAPARKGDRRRRPIGPFT